MVKKQGKNIVNNINQNKLKQIYIATINFQSVINRIADEKDISIIYTLDSGEKVGLFEIRKDNIEDFVNTFVQAGWANGELIFKYEKTPSNIDGQKIFNPISYSDLEEMVKQGKASSIVFDKTNGEKTFSVNLTPALKALNQHINKLEKENPFLQQRIKKNLLQYSMIRNNILQIRKHQKTNIVSNIYKKIKNNTKYITQKFRNIIIQQKEDFIKLLPEDEYNIIINIFNKGNMKSEDLEQIKTIFLKYTPIKETDFIYKFSESEGIYSEYAKVTNLGYLAEALTGALMQIQQDKTKLSSYMQSVDSVSGLLQGDFTFKNFEIAVKSVSSKSLSIYQVVYVAEQIVIMQIDIIPQFLQILKQELKKQGSSSGAVSQKDLSSQSKKIFQILT